MIDATEKSIAIEAPATAVWNALTDPDLMKQWMAEPELGLKITTDWKIGSSIIIKGFHHLQFENKGIVLQFEPYSTLQYNYLSSISRLPDKPENYTSVEFSLSPVQDKTFLKVIVSNFPTETIYKHVDFYWRGTVVKLKKLAESLVE